jgi:hypothetical protein
MIPDFKKNFAVKQVKNFHWTRIWMWVSRKIAPGGFRVAEHFYPKDQKDLSSGCSDMDNFCVLERRAHNLLKMSYIWSNKGLVSNLTVSNDYINIDIQCNGLTWCQTSQSVMILSCGFATRVWPLLEQTVTNNQPHSPDLTN